MKHTQPKHTEVDTWESKILWQMLKNEDNRLLLINLMKEMLEPPLRVYTVEQAAEIVGCSTKLLERFRKSGELRVLKIGPLVRILEEDLRRFLEERREISLFEREVL